MTRSSSWRSPTRLVIGLALVLLAIQVVPYGRNHINPPVGAEPRWNSPETRALAKAACFDCHSNETSWPPYSRVAPVSWLVYRDVVEGRSSLNFSEWSRPQKDAAEAAKEVRVGEMPPLAYRLAHPESRLDAQTRERLARGLDATLGQGQPGER